METFETNFKGDRRLFQSLQRSSKSYYNYLFHNFNIPLEIVQSFISKRFFVIIDFCKIKTHFAVPQSVYYWLVYA